jgi:hypothetical protein
LASGHRADFERERERADTKRILVTSALPYINGVKHLGNLVGSMLPADVYARFQRQRLGAENVLFICATDEHGTPAELAALDDATAAIEQPAGAVTMYRKHVKAPLSTLGDSLDDIDPSGSRACSHPRSSRLAPVGLQLNTILVNTGDKLVLIDAGYGVDKFQKTAGAGKGRAWFAATGPG